MFERLINGPAVDRDRSQPAAVLTQAGRDYQAMRAVLAELVPRVRGLLSGPGNEVEVVADVWLTLQANPGKAANLLGAIAIVDLAKHAASPGGSDLWYPGRPI